MVLSFDDPDSFLTQRPPENVFIWGQNVEPVFQENLPLLCKRCCQPFQSALSKKLASKLQQANGSINSTNSN